MKPLVIILFKICVQETMEMQPLRQENVSCSKNQIFNKVYAWDFVDTLVGNAWDDLLSLRV